MFSFNDIQQYHQVLLNGTTSCVEVVSSYLEEINRKKQLNIFIEVFAQEALQRAKDLDSKRNDGFPIGKLHGVVVSIKDIIGYKDHLQTAASATLQGFRSIVNSDVVQRLLDDEAIIIGSCNSDEFAMGTTNEHSFYGPVKNPLNEQYVPGGSSGGSAAAVAAGLCMVSLGTDTGGSARQPADYCGLYGFKPTYGCIDSFGIIPYAATFDQVGIIANSIDDINYVLSSISTDELDHSSLHDGIGSSIRDTGQLRIGLLKTAATHMSIDKEIGKTILDFCKQIENRFAIIDDIQLRLMDYLVPTYYILTTAEAAETLNRNTSLDTSAEHPDEMWQSYYRTNKGIQPGKEVKKRMMLGAYVKNNQNEEDYFRQAQRVRMLLLRTMNTVFEHFDFLLMPTVISTAPRLGAINRDDNNVYQSDIFTTLANLTGLPAISVPLFMHSNGMPFGLQILGPQGSDIELLTFAKTLAHK